ENIHQTLDLYIQIQFFSLDILSKKLAFSTTCESNNYFIFRILIGTLQFVVYMKKILQYINVSGHKKY
ncbi:hypothetical protein ACFCVX_24355, partial [Bacillus toyonensis]|uniref:hypothetical protein n=1 Tax=Bacillus toyonensis TaxID=155322 RepID=UPI0035DA4739